MNTLLVIDMQNAWLRQPRHDKEGVIARINQAARAMRQSGGTVVFIRHCSEEALAGSDDWQLDGTLDVRPDDVLFDKSACDSFADTALLPHLQQSGTQTLYICGLATEFCVDTTLRAALSRGFNVTALADAHTTSDRPHLTAVQIIEHHNWIWADMAAPLGRSLRVCDTAQALATLT
jgi:nicotinamidase-related amidase